MQRGVIDRTGRRLRGRLCRTGFCGKSLESFYTGDFTVCPPAPMNGIPEICTSKECRRMNITGKRMENSGSLVIKTLSRCFARKDLILRHGCFFLRRRVPAMCSRWRSTMTGSRCMRANFRIGTRRRWDQREIFLGELKSAAESCGLQFCTSSHRAEHWFFHGTWKGI